MGQPRLCQLRWGHRLRARKVSPGWAGDRVENVPGPVGRGQGRPVRAMVARPRAGRMGRNALAVLSPAHPAQTCIEVRTQARGRGARAEGSVDRGG